MNPLEYCHQEGEIAISPGGKYVRCEPSPWGLIWRVTIAPHRKAAALPRSQQVRDVLHRPRLKQAAPQGLDVLARRYCQPWQNMVKCGGAPGSTGLYCNPPVTRADWLVFRQCQLDSMPVLGPIIERATSRRRPPPPRSAFGRISSGGRQPCRPWPPVPSWTPCACNKT